MDKQKMAIVADTIEKGKPISKVLTEFNMANWIVPLAAAGPDELLIECGAAGCIAGWTVATFEPAHFETLTHDDWGGDIAEKARQMLELTEEQAGMLFTPSFSDYDWITPAKAAAAVRNMAALGRTLWANLLAESDDIVMMAEVIAKALHGNQHDRCGVIYWKHLEAVAAQVETQRQKAIAWLHDTIEDTGTSPEDLFDFGFPQDVVDGVVLLTRMDEDTHRWMYPSKVRPTYMEYIQSIADSGDRDVMLVKIADNVHNMNPDRAVEGEHESHVKRYQKSKAFLEERLSQLT